MPSTIRVAVCLSAAYLVTLICFSAEGARFWLALALVAPLVWLSVADLSSRVIPDGAWAVVACIGVMGLASDPWLLALTLGTASAAVAVLALAGQSYWQTHGTEALGLGDAKLIGAGIVAVGIESLWMMLLLASLGGIAAALLDRRTRTAGVPFGPFLAYSIFITYLFSGS